MSTSASPPPCALEHVNQSQHFPNRHSCFVAPSALFYSLVPPWPTNSVTFTARKANIHKQVSLGKGSRCLKRLFSPACLSRHFHPSANEISTALSSCGYTGISPITSNKQPADELEFRACENMNLKLKLAPRNPPMLSKRVQLKPPCLARLYAAASKPRVFSHGFAFPRHIWG